MMRKVALYGFATFALASSALAYIYTCEDGKFQIDVPEGWGGHMGDGHMSIRSKYEDANRIIIYYLHNYYLDKWFMEGEMGKSLGDRVNIQELYEFTISELGSFECELFMDRFLSIDENRSMNIDDGFITFFDDKNNEQIVLGGTLKKGNTVYFIGGEMSYECYYSEGKDIFIKVLNSFRALD